MFNFEPTPYWHHYAGADTPDEHNILFHFICHGGVLIDEYNWTEDITETGYLEFSKKIFKATDSITEELLGYVVRGHIYHSSLTDIVAIPIQRVFKGKEEATKFYSDLNNYWMRAELEIQKEKQRDDL